MRMIIRVLPISEVMKIISTMANRNRWICVWLESPRRMKFIPVVPLALTMALLVPERCKNDAEMRFV